MADDPDWTQEHAPAMRNHWWWRPGWREGRRFWTWHFTFEGAAELHETVSRYQHSLKGVSTLDLIPQRWLHLTVQGLGFVDELDDADVYLASQAVQLHLNQLPPMSVEFGPAIVRPEAIAMPPRDPTPLVQAKRAIRQGIADAWGSAKVPESAANFQPHVSIAYSNAELVGTADIQRKLNTVNSSAQAVLERPRLIRLHRDNRMYEWSPTTEQTSGSA